LLQEALTQPLSGNISVKRGFEKMKIEIDENSNLKLLEEKDLEFLFDSTQIESNKIIKKKKRMGIYIFINKENMGKIKRIKFFINCKWRESRTFNLYFI
jgi:hypothetical protein